MTQFSEALWDGSDPLYAPCISWTGKYPSWKCPKRYLDAGYEVRSVRLQPPGHRDDEHQPERALECRRLTQALMNWWNNLDTPDTMPDTWEWVIHHYRTDEFSPYQEVKANTRESYDGLCDRWLAVIGHMKVSTLDFVTIKKIQKAMQDAGRTVSNIKRMFTMLRTLARYAYMMKATGAGEVVAILSNIRLKSPPARSVSPTREEIEAIVAESDKAGCYSFSAGLLLQFEYILRAVDVRGQWLVDDGQGGITRTNKAGVTKRWQDGLTWDMFDPELTKFEKVISKTAGSLPEPYEFDLTLGS